MTAIEFPTPDPRSLDDAARPFAEAVSASYAVKRMIGRGGMGVVYLARDRRLDRLVAIKTLPPALAADPAVRERFLRETRTAGGMAHPNIVPIHGADELDGHVFFVMSYIDGDSLAAQVRGNGRLESRTAARYLRDVAAALAHAHRRGIIHRDIKAENILIERASDRALVTDFGIARLAEATPLTVTGQVLGTVHYVSPEQVTGDVLDARSDIYSLGVVGFLALTGRFPFDADVASAVLVAHVTKAPPPVASINRAVPGALASIIDRCLMKDPAHRFASADDLHAAIETALASLDQQAAPTLISEAEAHAVWKRAAELQAATGIHPRPEIVVQERDEAGDRARGAGYGVGEVREAANEAGIDDRYVEHALVEHGLLPRIAAPPARTAGRTAARDSSSNKAGVSKDAPPATGIRSAGVATTGVSVPVEKPSFWAGSPLYIVREFEVKGELPARDVERMINVLRDATGHLGTTSAKTRELAWSTGRLGARFDVSVVPEEGRTTVRLVKSERRMAIAAMLSSTMVLGFIGGPMVGAITHELFGAPEEFAVMVGLAAGLVMPWKFGRAVVRRFRARSAERLRLLGERLAAKVRESVEQG